MRLIDADALIEEIANMDISEQSKLFSVNMLRMAPTAYNVDKVIHKTKCHFIDKIDDADKSDYCRLVNESHAICDIIRNGGKE